MIQPQIYKGDSRPRILPYVMASSAMGSNGGSSGFCQAYTQEQMLPQSSCGVLHMFISTLRPQLIQVTYAPDELWLFWLQTKPEDPQFEPRAERKMAQVLGSPLYTCGLNFNIITCYMARRCLVCICFTWYACILLQFENSPGISPSHEIFGDVTLILQVEYRYFISPKRLKGYWTSITSSPQLFPRNFRFLYQ